MLSLIAAPLYRSLPIAIAFTLQDSEKDCLLYEVPLNALIAANHSHGIFYDPINPVITMGLYVSESLLVCEPLGVCTHILIIFVPRISGPM